MKYKHIKAQLTTAASRRVSARRSATNEMKRSILTKYLRLELHTYPIILAVFAIVLLYAAISHDGEFSLFKLVAGVLLLGLAIILFKAARKT